MAVPTGIEPAISCVTGRHVNRYTTGPKDVILFDGLIIVNTFMSKLNV